MRFEVLLECDGLVFGLKSNGNLNLPRRSSMPVVFVKMSGFACLRPGYAGTVFVRCKASNEDWAIQGSNL